MSLFRGGARARRRDEGSGTHGPYPNWNREVIDTVRLEAVFDTPVDIHQLAFDFEHGHETGAFDDDRILVAMETGLAELTHGEKAELGLQIRACGQNNAAAYAVIADYYKSKGIVLDGTEHFVGGRSDLDA